MADCTSDSDDCDKFEWDIDDEDKALSSPISRSLDAPGPSMLVWQDTNGKANEAGPSDSSVRYFVDMGFTEEMVLKAIKQTGGSDSEAVLNLLLAYKMVAGDPSVDNCSTSGYFPRNVEDADGDDVDIENWDDDNASLINNMVPNYDDEDFLQEMSQKDAKIMSLVSMGFPKDEANMAITRCGLDASLDELADSIYASQTAGGCSRNLSDHEDNERYCFGRKKTKFMENNNKKRKRYGCGAQGSRVPLDGQHDVPMPLPNPMVGFNLPGERLRSVNRTLPEQAIGPPYFYYENVAHAPKGVWTTMSRFLYDIEPEFVDSMYFCAAARKRGYIHNLPIENRSPLLPQPPKTILEAFPYNKKWWPSWDPRKQFNCLLTARASAKQTERIRNALSNCQSPPPLGVQKKILEECRTWNLMWVGKNKLAPLEAHEIEFLLGFPRNHTRGGATMTDRYKSLGNSFQVDTVAYHLSVLRNMFPNGMNVLSLFTGIGGAEVALHRLGIRMKIVVSVEISKANRSVLQSWWDDTRQTGKLIDEIVDVRNLTDDKIKSLVRRFGGFDLVIGGSPCNNLAGGNRHHRDGLEGEQSALFYHYVRILGAVKSAMARM